MPDLDFHAHVAARGDALGAGTGSEPAEWEAALGPDYLDDRSEDLLRRDYGLVELSFQKSDDTWPCFGVSIQVHRLLPGAAAVPRPLRDAYGEFARRVRFDELRDMITGLGHTVEPDDAPPVTDMHRYRVSVPAPGSSSSRIPTRTDPATRTRTTRTNARWATSGRSASPRPGGPRRTEPGRLWGRLRVFVPLRAADRTEPVDGRPGGGAEAQEGGRLTVLPVRGSGRSAHQQVDHARQVLLAAAFRPAGGASARRRGSAVLG